MSSSCHLSLSTCPFHWPPVPCLKNPHLPLHHPMLGYLVVAGEKCTTQYAVGRNMQHVLMTLQTNRKIDLVQWLLTELFQELLEGDIYRWISGGSCFQSISASTFDIPASKSYDISDRSSCAAISSFAFSLSQHCHIQPSAYRLTIYPYAIIVSFSKYR